MVNHGLYILSDEVYEHLIFDGRKHTSVLNKPALRERAFITFSFGKIFHNTGWKMGYCVAPDNLMKEFRRIHQFLVFSCNRPVQHALAQYLEEPKHYLELDQLFRPKRDFFCQSLESSAFDFEPSQGTYFQLLNYSRISGLSDMEFCRRMTSQHGVAAIPVSAFYHDGYDAHQVRLCFAKSESILERGILALIDVSTEMHLYQ